MRSRRVVAFDGCVLGLAFGINNSKILDPGTNGEIIDGVGRVRRLLGDLAEENARLVIPTLVIAELATANLEATRLGIATIATSNSVDLAPMDLRCSYEWAVLAQNFIKALPEGLSEVEAAKQTSAAKKFDYGILAAVKVHRCEVLFTGDTSLANRAVSLNIKCTAVHELPRPLPEQSGLFPGG